MPAKKHTPEQIIAKLREAEVENFEGHPVPIACKKIDVSEQAHCPWLKGARTCNRVQSELSVNEV
jgi:hypothetical protein